MSTIVTDVKIRNVTDRQNLLQFSGRSAVGNRATVRRQQLQLQPRAEGAVPTVIDVMPNDRYVSISTTKALDVTISSRHYRDPDVLPAAIIDAPAAHPDVATAIASPVAVLAFEAPRSIGVTAGSYVAYQLNVTTGQDYTFEAFDNATLILHDGTNVLVTQNTDNRYTNGERITWTSTITGTLFVVVQNNAASAASLTVQYVPNDPLYTDYVATYKVEDLLIMTTPITGLSLSNGESKEADVIVVLA